MIPRIQASETLDAATAAALGSGSLKKGDARRITSSLERRANAGQSRANKPDAAMLAAMGIGVEIIDG